MGAALAATRRHSVRLLHRQETVQPENPGKQIHW